MAEHLSRLLLFLLFLLLLLLLSLLLLLLLLLSNYQDYHCFNYFYYFTIIRAIIIMTLFVICTFNIFTNSPKLNDSHSNFHSITRQSLSKKETSLDYFNFTLRIEGVAGIRSAQLKGVVGTTSIASIAWVVKAEHAQITKAVPTLDHKIRMFLSRKWM